MTRPLEPETTRLRLVPWADRHLAPFAALNADPEVMRDFPSTLDEVRTRASIGLFSAHFDAHGFGDWAVELRTTGEFIGFVGPSIPRREEGRDGGGTADRPPDPALTAPRTPPPSAPGS